MELHRASRPQRTLIRRVLSFEMSIMVLLILVATGCQRLGKNSPNEVASVVIANQSMGKVAAATEVAFIKHEYQGGRTGPAQYTYQRGGSQMDAVVYGEWIDRKVALRAVVTLNEVGTNSVRVSCDARMVSAPGDPVFEETFKVRGSDKKEIETIMTEIVDQASRPTNPGTDAKPVP
jgi:hypothetical protein